MTGLSDKDFSPFILFDFKYRKEKFSYAYGAVKKLSEFRLVVDKSRVDGLNKVNGIRITVNGRNFGNELKNIKEVIK